MQKRMYTGSEHELAHHCSQGRSKNKASTSLYDSLMLVVACMVEEEVEKAMSLNDSLVLVVAAIVKGEAKIKHQRVVMTHWCWLWPPWSRENRKKTPPSRNDLLVLAWSREKQPTSLYNSLVLVVACMVKGGWWKGVEAYNLDVSN